MEFKHIPVLFVETITSLQLNPEGKYIDGTMGGAGHSKAILEQLDGGRLLSIDQDPDAIAQGQEMLKGFPNSTIVEGNFREIEKIAKQNGMNAVDGVLLDIGVSSYQLDDPKRGFSYHNDAALDMRMSGHGPSAKDLVNTADEVELARIIFQYGEDKCARRIARGIVAARKQKEIETTAELANIIKESLPMAVKRKPGHPARKVFQALRIEVNGELDALREGLIKAFSLLKPKGRLAVITFHSLEDRIVKTQMNDWCKGCTCPSDFPVCVCGKTPLGKLVYKKGKTPETSELEQNPRARSARLRVIEKH